jgi:uncharacterized membrane protein
LHESSDAYNAKGYVNHEHFFAVDVKGNAVLERSQKKPKLWQTKDITPDYFLIIPFSPFFMAWNALLSLVVCYDAFMVLFAWGFDFRIEGGFMAIDVFCYCVLAGDMFVRAKTAITTPKKLCFDPKRVFDYYVNNWMLLDVAATFPLCYFLMIAPHSAYKYLAWARLLRLLKIFRFLETVEVFKWNSDVRVELYRIGELFLLYGFTGHVLGVLWGYFGAIAYANPIRFDRMTLFKFTETRPWEVGFVDNLAKRSPWEIY